MSHTLQHSDEWYREQAAEIGDELGDRTNGNCWKAPPEEPSQTAPLRAFTAAELQRHTFEYRRPLLFRGESAILREGHLSEIYAVRGIGKTWFAHTLAHIVANPIVSALGFRSEEAARVLVVDGEMAGPELQQRNHEIAHDKGHAACGIPNAGIINRPVAARTPCPASGAQSHVQADHQAL